MDELLIRQLTRQLRILNIWLTFLGVIFIVGFVILGILIYKVLSFTHDVSNKFTSLQKTEQSLNIQKQACSNSSISSFLQKNTSICK